MSCITELLKLKGDKKFLKITDNGHPCTVIEGGGTYKGYEYLITLNISGYRCGYVAIPSDHKINNSYYYNDTDDINYSELDIQCHGHHLKELLTHECKDLWLGFDCMHSNDRCDEKAFLKYHNTTINGDIYLDDSTIKNFQYVEKQCHSIIHQLINQ